MSTATIKPRVATGRPPVGKQPVLALARVEGRRMLRHPAFLVGLAATVAQVTIRPGSEDWAGQSHYLTSTAWTFAWIGMLLAAALTAGREQFHGDPDLFPATPVPRGDRVLGTALGLLGPALVAAIAVIFVAVRRHQAGGFLLGEGEYGRAHDPSLFEWAQPIMLVVLAGVVGILVAQLRRARLAALIVAVIATFFGGTMIWAFQVHPVRVLHPYMFPTYEDSLGSTFTPEGWGPDSPPLIPPGEYHSTWHAVRADTGALGWHLVYVAGLVLVGVWLAARMADRGKHVARIRWLLLAGLPLLLVGGVAQIATAGISG